VLLTAPEPVVAERLRTRMTSPYAREGAELAQALADRDEIEPLLRRSADLVLETTVPAARVADALLERLAALDGRGRRIRGAAAQPPWASSQSIATAQPFSTEMWPSRGRSHSSARAQ